MRATALLIGMVWSGPAQAEVPAEARSAEMVQPKESAPETGLSFLGLMQTRVSATNVVPTNPFLDGQVVGTTGGLNQTDVRAAERAVGSELRTTGFLTYAPPMLDGRASLTGGFEIDMGFGDQSYGEGGNTGGGFGADQVNLQTRRLYATFRPLKRERDELDVVLGLQFVADGVYDPQKARPDDLFRTGGGLRFFGSEATGMTLYGVHRDAWGERLRWRLGAYTLWEAGVGQPDDVTLYLGDAQWVPEGGWRVGGHIWHLRDRSGGQIGALGVGPTSALSELQGGPRLDFRFSDDDPVPQTDADVLWVAADGGFNHDLREGPIGFSALAVFNLSGFYVLELPDDTGIGWLGAAEVRGQIAPGDGSVARAEVLWVSDDDADQDGYGSVLTGNSYGIVGSQWTTHGSLLLFPDPLAINRQTAVVYDVSNGGRGLVALSGSLGYDVVPHRLNVTGGLAHARQSDRALGTELTLRARVRPLPLMDVGAAGAVVLGSGFDAAPWTTFAYLQWVIL